MAAGIGIRSGQYWILEGGFIAVVIDKSETEDEWEVNQICPQGVQMAKVSYDAASFQRELNPHQARRHVLEIVQAAAMRHLLFA